VSSASMGKLNSIIFCMCCR